MRYWLMLNRARTGSEGSMSEHTPKPRAWLTTRTLDGTKTLRLADTTANAEYAKAHRNWQWEPLYDQATLDAAVAAERERCAVIAEKTVCDTHLPTGVRIYGTVAGKAIRAA